MPASKDSPNLTVRNEGDMRLRSVHLWRLIVGLLLLLPSTPAFANRLDRAFGFDNCQAFLVYMDGSDLKGPATVFYRIWVIPSSGNFATVDGAIPVTPDASFKFVAVDTKTWASAGLTLNGSYTLVGVAALIFNGAVESYLQIPFTPSTLKCGPPPPPPHLTISKEPKVGTFVQGSQVSFTMVVGNDGGSPATNAHVHDELPGNGGLVWATATTTQGTCSLSSNVLDCDLGTIPPAGNVTIVVTSTNPTPPTACQLQPNPAAIATADGGLRAEDSGGLSCTPPPLPCPAGSFTFHFDAAGNLVIVFDQFPAPNDNSYGVNAVGWGTHAHRFSDLVGSDHAGFQLRDAGGTVRLSFNIDYISANANAPSGYASLGPFGGDGKVLVGTLTPADILWNSSLALNLNNVNIPGLFNAAHVQQFGSVNLLVDSPPTDPLHETYSNSDPLLVGWDFHDTYYVTISAAKLASLGFNSSWKVEPNLDALHNSPAKACPPPSDGHSLSVAKTEVKDKQVKVTLLNSGFVDEIITGVQVSWPAANGNLVQVKLDGDVIYDNPDIAPPSATLTLAQLVADPNKRKIKHGESDVLIFIFQNNADPTLSNYTGIVDTSGFALTILP